MKVGIVCNPDKALAASTAVQVADQLRVLGVDVLAAPGFERSPSVVQEADALVVLGGDGTMLGVARELGGRQTPVLGVNVGSFGFLTEIMAGELEEAVGALVDGTAPVSDRMMLQAELCGADGTVRHVSRALNDVLVARRALGRIVVLAVSVGNAHLATYRGDGVVVASPTGSTGHSLAAGGPVVSPEVDALILTPVCPHTFGHRGLVLPTREALRIRAAYRQRTRQRTEVSVTLDGQVEWPLGEGDELTVGRATTTFRLVGASRRSYYQILQSKFGLGDQAP